MARLRIRVVVRLTCAAALGFAVSAGRLFATEDSSAMLGLSWATTVAAIGVALFLGWAALRPGFRALGFGLGAIVVGGAAAWAALTSSGLPWPDVLAPAACLLGVGSTIVHLRSDREAAHGR